jgi:hypothetical protein
MSIRRRAGILLLLLGFFGGGLGLPLLDALTFHGRHVQPPEDQLAKQGAALPHGLNCIIVQGLHSKKVLPCAAAPRLAALEAVLDLQPFRYTSHRSVSSRTPTLPRAPPRLA